MPINQAESGVIRSGLLAAGDLAYQWDLDSDRLTWAGDAARFFGMPEPSALGTGEAFQGRINPEDLPYRQKAILDHHRTRETMDCEYRVRQGDGRFSWIHDRAETVRDADGSPVRLCGIMRLITRRKQHEARLEHLANYDELTGHFNRNRLREALNQALLHSQRYDVPGAYLSVGIDKMTLINDAYGYFTADAVIVGVGQRLERILRASDVVGRVGGDVYGIVLSHCPQEEMAVVAEKILRVFRDNPVNTPSGLIHVTVSIGGVAFPDYVQTPFEAMARAEAAMADGKRQGCDTFCMYRVTEAQRSAHRKSMLIGEQVKSALKDDRMQLAFQPVVHRGSHAVAMYECLIRMRTRDGDVVPAGTFVPVAEQLGLSRMLDRRVLELAAAELVQFPDVELAINISGLTLADPAWLRTLVSLLGSRADLARRLLVEITETAAIQDIDESARFVEQLREMGCRVALDDFGAGYTSFRHLRSLKVDVVKIDGSFVRNLATNRDNQIFVRTLVGLARGFGLKTVAECVESREDAELLDGEAVDYLQGHHFARPTLERPWVPAAERNPFRLHSRMRPTLITAPLPERLSAVG